MQYSSAADACRGGDRNSSTFRRTAPRRLHSLAADEVIAALADYFVPPYSFRYPYYNLNGAFWPHLRILQKKNAMNYLFIAFLTPYSIFSLAVCSCIQ